MAPTKFKKPRAKTQRQIEAEERKYYSCSNCRHGIMLTSYCRKLDVFFDEIESCGEFEVKLGERDCTKCIHYNKRKNAASKCKIGIYNCEGVKNG